MRNYEKELKKCNKRIKDIYAVIDECNQEIARLMEKPNLKHLKKIK